MNDAVSYAQLKDAISAAYPGLSRQLQRIAQFALEKPQDLALGTVASVADAANVQPSSMIRFANALGFSGFSQMQQVFRSHLLERSSSYRERIARMRNGDGDGTGVLHRFVAEAVAELGHLEDNVHAADVKAAVRALVGAQQIHVLAQRRAFPVACYLAYALGQLELRTRLLDGVGGMLAENVKQIDRRDVLVAASFRNYSPEVIDAAVDCHRRGVPVIAITDSALSPLKAPAAVCFELGDDSSRLFRSLVGPLCFVQALVVSTGHALADRRAKRK